MEEASGRARHVIVRGRVQGVWFRRSLQERADELGVRGWVRNRDDGSVEAWLEGAAVLVEEVLAWVRDGGPPGAAVTQVEVDERAPQGHRGFEVR